MITLSLEQAEIIRDALNDAALQAFSENRRESGQAYRRLRGAMMDKIKEERRAIEEATR